MLELAKEIAELRIRGGVCEADIEHTNAEINKIIRSLEEERDDLQKKYGDGCDHNEAMKEVLVNGGVYCCRCEEKVNDYPKDPQMLGDEI